MRCAGIAVLRLVATPRPRRKSLWCTPSLTRAKGRASKRAPMGGARILLDVTSSHLRSANGERELIEVGKNSLLVGVSIQGLYARVVAPTLGDGI